MTETKGKAWRTRNGPTDINKLSTYDIRTRYQFLIQTLHPASFCSDYSIDSFAQAFASGYALGVHHSFGGKPNIKEGVRAVIDIPETEQDS